MPGFTEQQRAWRQEIQEAEPEVIFRAISREVVVSPAERVRYKEHAKLGAMLVDDLLWTVSQDQSLDEAAIEQRFQALADRGGLTNDQRERLTSVRDALVRQYLLTKKVGRRELLRRAESGVDRISGGLVEFRFSHVDPDDIEVTPFGAILVTIRDRHVWEEELGKTKETKGSTTRIDKEHAERLSLREREAIERTIFLRATDDGQWQSSVKLHELFHDLHKYVFGNVMRVDYKNSEQIKCFRELRNELVAYAISEDWQLHLCALLNSEEMTNKSLRRLIASRVEKEWTAEGMDEKEAHARAIAFTMEISAVEYHLCRLGLSGSEAFKEWLCALIASESVKELAYHLSQIPSDPIDAAKVLIQPGGMPHFGKATDLVHWASLKKLPVLHIDELIESIRRKLEVEKAKDASSRAVQNWTKLLEEVLLKREKMEPRASTAQTGL